MANIVLCCFGCICSLAGQDIKKTLCIAGDTAQQSLGREFLERKTPDGYFLIEMFLDYIHTRDMA